MPFSYINILLILEVQMNVGHSDQWTHFNLGEFEMNKEEVMKKKEVEVGVTLVVDESVEEIALTEEVEVGKEIIHKEHEEVDRNHLRRNSLKCMNAGKNLSNLKE